MTDDLNPQWQRHFDGIADEFMRLAIACDVRLRDPGVIERILKDDATVCGRKNEEGFSKMRKLLVAFFDSVSKAAERIGPDDTRKIIAAITKRKQQERDREDS